MANSSNGAPYWFWPETGGSGFWMQPKPEDYASSSAAMPFDPHHHNYQMLNEMMVGAYQQQEPLEQDEVYVDDSGPDDNLAGFSRPRLRWVPELHEHFERAVDELGGPCKAKPKAILSLMGVEGLTLFHIKSHLQKYRLVKGVKKESRSEGQDGSKPHSGSSKGQGSSSQALITFDTNVSRNGYRVDKGKATRYGLEHYQFVEEGTSGETATMEGFTTTFPPLLPLFPTGGMDYPSGQFPQWYEMLGAVVQNPVIPQPIELATMDSYFNCFNYSSEFALAQDPISGQGTMRYGSFYDDVASFLNMDANVFPGDDNFLPMPAGDLSAGVTSYFPGF